MKNTQKQRDKLGKILAERLEKPAKEDEKKHLKKELEDLADKIEQNEKDRQEERDKLDKTTRELEGLKKTFTLSGRDKKLLPGELEGEFYNEERDNRLYLPLIQAIEDDDDLCISEYIYKGNTPQEVIDFIEDHEREIIDQQAETIYYSDAIDYLKENDRTLTESLELAKNAGYDIDSLNSCTLATLLKIENENYSGQFQDAMEKLKDKAEELEQAREENEKATGLEMDEFIDQRAKNRAERHRDNDRTPEELKKIEKLEQRRQEIEDHKKDLQTKYRTLKEDQNKKRIHLEELEQEDQNN